ncbi:unnamed protein product [Rhizophagus irregularis]|nr:unnamed protein product [Rhizophagus irregularis]
MLQKRRFQLDYSKHYRIAISTCQDKVDGCESELATKMLELQAVKAKYGMYKQHLDNTDMINHLNWNHSTDNL